MTIQSITELEALDDGEKLGPFTTEQLEAMLAEEEDKRSVTSELAAILDDPYADQETSRLTGKPYAEGETPITPEEAREVIEEMRRAVSSDGTIALAKAVANELGLDVQAWAGSLEMSEADVAQMFEESQFVPSKEVSE